MNISELINSGSGRVTVQVTPEDLKTFANTIAKELAKTKPPPQKQDKYLTADQVCELLSISRVSLWTWDKKGITSPVRIGNLKRYRLSDIEAMGK